MNRFKKMIIRAFYPGAVWVFLLAALCAAALIFIFYNQLQEAPAAYAVYLISAYTLTAAVLYIRRLSNKVNKKLRSNRITSRIINDIPFRTMLSLIISFSINIIYAVFNFITGFIYLSYWYGALSFYYLILGVLRVFILLGMRKKHSDPLKELKRYRLCGAFLFVLNIALSGVVFQIINRGEGYSYNGLLIYAAAAYAFYLLIIAIVGMVRYRRLNRPLVSAAKAVSLSAALVSMFALQTAMLSAFGAGEEEFRFIMNYIFGGCVCLIIFCIAGFILFSSNRKLKKFQNNIS